MRRKRKKSIKLLQRKVVLFSRTSSSRHSAGTVQQREKKERHNLDEMLMRGEGNVEGKDRNKPNSHLMTSLSIILNPFTVPRCENRISPDRKDLMAVSGLRARDHHFLPRQISSATCPHKSLFQTDKIFEHKIRLEKDTWQIFMAFILSSHPHPPPPWKKKKKNCRTDDVAILRSFVNCQPGLTLQKTNREHGGSARLHGEEEGKESAVVFTNKETFCLPFAAPVKSTTNMEIHYRQLLQKCDQSLCSQLGTGNWGRCLSADGQKRLSVRLSFFPPVDFTTG